MKSVILIAAFAACLCTTATNASAKTSCDDLREKIEAKLKAKGVKVFTLTILPKGDKTSLRVVGTCDGGTRKIVYKRG